MNGVNGALNYKAGANNVQQYPTSCAAINATHKELEKR